jgi:hypothetical protein
MTKSSLSGCHLALGEVDEASIVIERSAVSAEPIVEEFVPCQLHL